MSVAMPGTYSQSKPASSPVRENLTPEGRLRIDGLSESDRNYSIAMHLSALSFFILGPLAAAAPLVLWLTRKDQSAFNDDHGRETVNFLITFFIAGILTFWTVVVPIVLTIIGVINICRGALAAGRGEYFRYPMTFRFIG